MWGREGGSTKCEWGVVVVRGGGVRRIYYWVSESRGEIGNCSKNKRALTETGT